MNKNVSILSLGSDAQRQIAEKIAAEDALRRAAKAAGGYARAAALTAEERTDIARRAATARWNGEPRPSKFGNVRTSYRSVQGFTRTYDSKGEARQAEVLDLGITTGLVLWWLPQPVFPLPGEKRSYRGDFLVVWADGRVAVQDFKGVDTPKSKDRRKEVKAHYGLDVEIVRPA